MDLLESRRGTGEFGGVVVVDDADVADLDAVVDELAQELVVIAGDVGISRTELAQIAWGPDSALWSKEDAAILRVADDLITDGTISDSTWTALTGFLSTQEILDAIFTVGAYETLGWMLRSLGIELDEDVRKHLEAD